MNQTILRNDLRHLCWVAQPRQKKFILSTVSPSSAFKRVSMVAGENAKEAEEKSFWQMKERRTRKRVYCTFRIVQCSRSEQMLAADLRMCWHLDGVWEPAWLFLAFDVIRAQKKRRKYYIWPCDHPSWKETGVLAAFRIAPRAYSADVWGRILELYVLTVTFLFRRRVPDLHPSRRR